MSVKSQEANMRALAELLGQDLFLSSMVRRKVVPMGIRRFSSMSAKLFCVRWQKILACVMSR